MSTEFQRSGVPRMPMVDSLHPEGTPELVANDLPKVKLVISGRKKKQSEVTRLVSESRVGPTHRSFEELDEAFHDAPEPERKQAVKKKNWVGVVKRRSRKAETPNKVFRDDKRSPFHQSPQALHKLTTSKRADETLQSEIFSLELAIGSDEAGEKENDFFRVRWTDDSDVDHRSFKQKENVSNRSEGELRQSKFLHHYDSDSIAIQEKCPEMNLNNCRILRNNDDDSSLGCDSEGGLMLENDNYTLENEDSSSLEASEVRRIFSCSYCEFIGNKHSWLSHLAQSHADKSLSFCTFKNCQMPFENETKLASHIAEAHESIFACSFYSCARTFHARSSLVEHEKSHVNEEKFQTKDNQAKISTEDNEESFICTYCGKKYRTRNGFKAHEAMVHTRKLKHKCSHEGCSAAFFYFSELAIHNRKHTGELPFTCSYCGARYISHATLAQHERAAHLQTEDTECHICHKKLRKRNLPGHLKTHEGYDGVPCTVCGKEFPTIGGKNRHEKIHFEVKQHSCSFCGKSFVQRANMVAHERIHTGERPYKCKHCHMGFPQQTRRNQHEQICKHGDPCDDQHPILD